MISGYAQAKEIAKSYIGLMASIFARYPRNVVLACVEPTGVPSETRFVPTPADVIKWCEEKVRPMHEEAAREDRVNEQLRAREEWLNPDRTPEEQARRKQLADAWLQRADPRAAELSGQKPKGPPSPEEVQRLMNQAHDVGRSISGMKLLPETLKAMANQDQLRKHTAS